MGNTSSTSSSSHSIHDKRDLIEKYRPLWPYNGWVEEYIDKDLPTNNSFKSTRGRDMCRLQRHKTFSSNESDNVNGLQAFLRVFDKDLEVFETRKGKAVQQTVNNIMESSITGLQNRYPKFRPCRLIKTGSVAEGTKVGEMDEFDFLIVLDMFKNSNIRFSDFKLLLLEEIKKVLDGYVSWTFLEFNDPKLPKFYNAGYSFATTVHLHSDNYDMDVDIDICACVSLKASDIDNNVRFSAIKEKLLYQTVVHSFPDQECFLVFDDMHCETRLTIPSFEISPFLELGRESGQVKTYMYAKCIAKRLFPKYNRLSICSKCICSVVKSHHLKTIIRFMIKNHTDPSLWSDTNVPNRVLEVFDILVECIRESDRNDVLKLFYSADIAQLSIPGAVHLKLFCNYDKGRCLKGKFPIWKGAIFVDNYIYPDNSCALKTGITSIDKTVMSYFNFLKKDNWESFMLIFRVREMLYKLKEMEQI